MSSQRIAVGIIGAGSVTSAVHLPIVTRRSDLFEVAAIHDVDPRAMNAVADRFGISNERRYASLGELLADPSLEAVMVLNSGSHKEAVCCALRAGKHVFCEKPLAFHRDEMREISEAWRGAGKHLMVGYMKIRDPAVRRAVKLVADDGPAHSVDVLVLHPSSELQLATSEMSVDHMRPTAALQNRFSAERMAVQLQAVGDIPGSIRDLYTEVLLGSLIHDLAVMRSLGLSLDLVDWVDRWPTEGRTDSIIIQGRTENGVRITLRWFYLEGFAEYREEVRWIGARSSHLLRFRSPYYYRVPVELESLQPTSVGHFTAHFSDYHSGFETELLEFAAMVRNATPTDSDLVQALADLDTCQRIIACLAAREGVSLGGDLAGV